ncbi:MAG: YXWGXW repeat-containing protein, partial [Pirellulaceae bacterium]|nr:YXWGXW repeat-containing protein [Pirellulaceae bacterium]
MVSRRYSKRKLFTWWTGTCAALAISPVFAQPGAQAPNAPQATILSDDTGDQLPAGAEVLVSGPLHEAFAEQFTNVPTPGLIVGKEPPTAIDELPPEYRPDGYDIVWIPGYWGWDQDRDDFVWITGVWRESPPDRMWIPGYWSQVSEGFQWTSGFWAANSSTEIEYLPPPPEPLTAEPSSEPPAADQFWIPGQWNYVNNSYQWRAGYWTVAYPDWVWVPD